MTSRVRFVILFYKMQHNSISVDLVTYLPSSIYNLHNLPRATKSETNEGAGAAPAPRLLSPWVKTCMRGRRWWGDGMIFGWVVAGWGLQVRARGGWLLFGRCVCVNCVGGGYGYGYEVEMRCLDPHLTSHISPSTSYHVASYRIVVYRVVSYRTVSVPLSFLFRTEVGK